MGLLIADVSGKGTSAAFYMAELKGLMLSLSRIHTSPRALLIEANRIISRHLDSRIFITMTYALIDLRAASLTCARAGHTPFIRVPAGIKDGPRAEVLAPDGMVLGLNLDGGERFERYLEENDDPVDAGGRVFLLYRRRERSDGRHGECFGENRITDSFSRMRASRRKLIRDRLLDAVDDLRRGAAAARRHHDGHSQDRAGCGVRVTMDELTVVFTSASDIEARVVRGLLESHGIESLLSSGHSRSIFPIAVGGIGDIKISVRPDDAEEARRLIESHRTEQPGGRVIPLRQEFAVLEGRLGYTFRDPGLLEHALTHTSRANEDVSGGVIDNESLEFLGDAVLGFAIADVLFRRFPEHDEGWKSKMKAALVSTASLARLAEGLDLGEHLLLGRGEEKTGGRRKQALLADGYEALIAAIYLDGGIDHATAFIARQFEPLITEVRAPAAAFYDFKSALQERVQSAGGPLPEYVVTGETGPDHHKTFHVEVRVGGRRWPRLWAGARRKQSRKPRASRWIGSRARDRDSQQEIKRSAETANRSR